MPEAPRPARICQRHNLGSVGGSPQQVSARRRDRGRLFHRLTDLSVRTMSGIELATASLSTRQRPPSQHPPNRIAQGLDRLHAVSTFATTTPRGSRRQDEDPEPDSQVEAELHRVP